MPALPVVKAKPFPRAPPGDVPTAPIVSASRLFDGSYSLTRLDLAHASGGSRPVSSLLTWDPLGYSDSPCLPARDMSAPYFFPESSGLAPLTDSWDVFPRSSERNYDGQHSRRRSRATRWSWVRPLARALRGPLEALGHPLKALAQGQDAPGSPEEFQERPSLGPWRSALTARHSPKAPVPLWAVVVGLLLAPG